MPAAMAASEASPAGSKARAVAGAEDRRREGHGPGLAERQGAHQQVALGVAPAEPHAG